MLVERPRASLARDVHAGFFYVFTRDSTILGVAMLRQPQATCMGGGWRRGHPRAGARAGGSVVACVVLPHELPPHEVRGAWQALL